MAGGFNMNEEKHLLLPMDLQFFADEPNSDEPNSDNSNESGNSSTKDSQNPKNENPDGKETGKYHIDTQEIDLLKRKYPKIYSKIEKQAIEDARYVFPNACETKMVFTINARSLLNFFSKRCCERAQWEIRAVADEMLKLVKEVAPIIFKNAGAPCVRGACPEGSMSCGHPKSSKGDA